MHNSNKSETAHTPGPWHQGKACALDRNGHLKIYPPYEVEQWGQIARVSEYSEAGTAVPKKTVEANARLIAAAPAMAALLRIIYDTPGITPILPSGVARQIQDCLVTAGLIK